MSLQQIKKIAHKTLAGSMAVWLSGIVFLFCCQEMSAATQPEFCPLAKMSGHCDKADLNSDSSVVENTSAQHFDCCAFLPVVFDKARKVDTVQKQVAITSEPIRPRYVDQTTHFSTVSFVAINSRVADRHDSYLKNRVFRI